MTRNVFYATVSTIRNPLKKFAKPKGN